MEPNYRMSRMQPSLGRMQMGIAEMKIVKNGSEFMRKEETRKRNTEVAYEDRCGVDQGLMQQQKVGLTS